MNRLKIIQHNTLSWTQERKNELSDLYRESNPDIILLNSHSRKSPANIKIYPYTTYQSNKLNELNDGVAIAIKSNIKHTIIDNFDEEFIAVEIETSLGPIIIGTCYLPPRRPYVPYGDITRFLGHNKPVYLLCDFNGRHRILGNGNNNAVGHTLASLVNRGRMTILGPDFPTHITNTSARTPDLVVENKYANLNIHLEPGRASISDHLPIEATISVNSMQIPTTPRYAYKQADWDKYKNKLINKIIPYLNNCPTDFINCKIDSWYEDVLSAKRESIPKNSFQTKAHPLTSPELEDLKREYKDIRETTARDRWNPIQRQRYCSIRESMKEINNLFNEKWRQNTKKISNNVKDPKQFWQDIERYTDISKAKSPYLLNSQNEKVFEGRDKVMLHSNFWRKTVQITPEENQMFDKMHEDNISANINNRGRISPDTIVDLSKLSNTSSLTEPITSSEVVETIKHMENKAPGESTINKTDLQNLPPVMIARLTNIFNASLASGYFPGKFRGHNHSPPQAW